MLSRAQLLARLEHAEGLLAKAEQRLRAQTERLDNQQQRLDNQLQRLQRLEVTAQDFLKLHDRLSRQIVAMEDRLQHGLQALAAPADADARAQAVEELFRDVRDEQARARHRFGVVVGFEERLRRLEETLAAEAAATLQAYGDSAAEYGLRREFEGLEALVETLETAPARAARTRTG